MERLPAAKTRPNASAMDCIHSAYRIEPSSLRPQHLRNGGTRAEMIGPLHDQNVARTRLVCQQATARWQDRFDVVAKLPLGARPPPLGRCGSGDPRPALVRQQALVIARRLTIVDQ